MIDKTWLQELTTGDEVAVYYGYNGLDIMQVDRVTATQIVISNGDRYRRNEGDRIGKDYIDRSWLAQPTDAIREKAFRQNAIAQLDRIKWKDMPTAVLRQVSAILQAQAEVKQ